MNSFDVEAPRQPDYYTDLGISQQASLRDIKLAFRKLAKIHHPDKKAPGQSIDAADFRKIDDAYKFLSDKSKRAAYDVRYFELRYQWDRYRETQEAKRRYEERKQAAEQERRQRYEEERKRAEDREQERLARARENKAAEAERKLRMQKERQAAKERADRLEKQRREAKEKFERERLRQEKIRQAEVRSQEAARKAREQQERAARERIRKEKAEEAEKKSQEAAKKARMEQEEAARERLKNILIEERLSAVRRNWAKMREEEGLKAEPSTMPHPRSSECIHPEFGWPKKNGPTTCIFCGEFRRKWAFQCPECSIPACPRCKPNTVL